MKQSGMLLSFHTESLTKNGAGNRVRTGDLYLGKVPLYQLSYSRNSVQRAFQDYVYYPHKDPSTPIDRKADILITRSQQSRADYPPRKGLHALFKYINIE